jgi:hypothetical protein
MRLSNRRIKAADLSKKLAPVELAHPKPKILLLDLPDAALESLAHKGFNVRQGSFGKPYKIAKTGGYQPVIGVADLPNYTEQEIVVIDLHAEDYDSGPQGEKHRPNSETDIWAKCDKGFIDPRVRAMWHVRERFDRILEMGGAFVVFADAKQHQEFQFARLSGGQFPELYDVEIFPGDIWDFLSACMTLGVEDDNGEEMHPWDTTHALGKLVAAHLEGGRFNCTVHAGSWAGHDWLNLCQNKFGQPVGVAWLQKKEGTVIVVPQLNDKVTFLTNLFTDVLPELAPHLFPDIVRGRWTHQPEYELPKILQLKQAHAEIERRSQAEIAALETQIEKERSANGWLHDLLTATDATLVQAVKHALSTIGFQNIVDIDEERDREGKSRREDLQIQDQSPTLVVDVKGIAAFPSDEDALQADKHAAIRMREQKRTDLVGLSIVNHQRHLPPLERENAMPFRQELIDAAQERSLGLITTWDLYRLVRNSRKLGWRVEDIKPLFYNKGRIEPVPQHYEFIRTVAKAWTEKFGVVISAAELRVGDRIAVEFPIEFEEVEVDSIQVNDQAVESATVGDPAGLLWPKEKPKLREGMRVFRIAKAK